MIETLVGLAANDPAAVRRPEHIVDLAGAQIDADRNPDRAHALDREISQHGLGPVRDLHRNYVALADQVAHQYVRAPDDRVLERAVAEAALPIEQRLAVGMTRDLPAHH